MISAIAASIATVASLISAITGLIMMVKSRNGAN
jgi:hypothetical protein